MATRALKHNEVYTLGRNEKFVATVESAAIQKAIYFYDARKAAVEAGDWATVMTDQEKAEWNFSATIVWAGALANNTGFARLFAEHLLNDAAGVAIPEEGGKEIFSPQQITDIMVDAGIISRDHASFGKAWQAFLETVGIDAPVASWING